MSSAPNGMMHLFQCVLVFIITVVGAQRFLWGPRDIAALLGSQVTLPCRVDLGNDYLEWIEYTTTSRGKRIFLSFMNNARKRIDAEHPRREKYRIDGSYDLVIKDLRLEDAGIYRCRMLLSGGFRDAEIIVVSPLKCTKHVTVEQGRTIAIDCVVRYNKSSSSSHAPSLMWTRGHHRIIGTLIHDSHSVRHTISFVARQEDNGHIYTCNTFFESKPPDYTDTCHVQINVQSPPRNTRLIIVKKEYNPGESIKCKAEGNPSPTYTWERISGHGPIRIAGDTLVIQRSMEGNNTYRCIANNTIATIYRGDYADISFIVKGITTTIQSTSSWRRDSSRGNHRSSSAFVTSSMSLMTSSVSVLILASVFVT